MKKHLLPLKLHTKGVSDMANEENAAAMFPGGITINMDMASAAIRDIAGMHIAKIGAQNDKFVVIDADMGKSARTTEFSKKFPERYFNVGIAEQNAVSIMAGFAHEGFIPLFYTMAPFITMRACEQVRTDLCYGGKWDGGQATAILMGNQAGYSNCISGATHCGIEDCAIMGSMGGMTVLEPGDPWMIIKMLDAAIERKGIYYIRISREDEVQIYPENYHYEIGKALIPRDGNDGAFIAAGPCVRWALEAAAKIEEETGAKIRVIDMHTIKPVDKEAVASAAKTGRVVVVQDHAIIGGLGYYVGAAIAESGIGCKFKILGAKDEYVPLATPPFLYHENEMDTEGLVKNMKAML